MKRLKLTVVGSCLLFSLSGLGCRHSEPFEYKSNREIKGGPGLFTGEEGAWIIYKKKEPSVTSEPEEIRK